MARDWAAMPPSPWPADRRPWPVPPRPTAPRRPETDAASGPGPLHRPLLFSLSFRPNSLADVASKFRREPLGGFPTYCFGLWVLTHVGTARPPRNCWGCHPSDGAACPRGTRAHRGEAGAPFFGSNGLPHSTVADASYP